MPVDPPGDGDGGPVGAVVQLGVPLTISGTATDAGGGAVGAVEVSVDGATWHRASV